MVPVSNELLLETIGFLDLNEIEKCQYVSKRWRRLILGNNSGCLSRARQIRKVIIRELSVFPVTFKQNLFWTKSAFRTHDDSYFSSKPKIVKAWMWASGHVQNVCWTLWEIAMSLSWSYTPQKTWAFYARLCVCSWTGTKSTISWLTDVNFRTSFGCKSKIFFFNFDNFFSASSLMAMKEVLNARCENFFQPTSLHV